MFPLAAAGPMAAYFAGGAESWCSAALAAITKRPVTETGTDLDKAWAQQAIDALLAFDEAAEAARAAGKKAINTKTRAEHEDWYRKAAAAGIALNAGHGGKLQGKRHARATRMQAREDDCLRFARDLRVPFTNRAERAIRGPAVARKNADGSHTPELVDAAVEEAGAREQQRRLLPTRLVVLD